MNSFVTRKQTILRHKPQICKTIELKIDYSKLSQKSLQKLRTLFVEAKWFYNYCLSLDNIDDADTTLKSVPVKVKDEFEQRSFSVLSGQMKQAIKTRIFNSLKSLKELKKSGHKIGWLKFKSHINSVPLKQLNQSFYLDIANKRIRIQKIKQNLPVYGMSQLSPEMEITNATLIQKCGNFYLHVTTYCNPEPKNIPEQAIGIDFGCQTQLTLSNGIKIEFQVPVSKQLRKLDRRINKKVNGKIGKNRPSKNRRKLQLKRRKLYERLTNKKTDIRNKIVSVITENYKYVAFQDESIRAWHASNHGKKIHNSGIGAILSDLKLKSDTPILVDKFFPSTKLCPNCDKKNKLTLQDRIYSCECGFTEDRDIKSAKCILIEGLKQTPTEHREVPEDTGTSIRVHSLLSQIDGIKTSYCGGVRKPRPLWAG